MDNSIYLIVVLGVLFLSAGVVYIFHILRSPGSIEEAEKLIHSGHFKDAIQLLEKLLEKEERDPSVNFLMALAYEKQGDFQNAILYYKRILKFGRYNQNINEIKVRKRLASCYENINNYTEAKNEYLILTQIEPSNPENFYHAGKIFYMAKQYQNATKLLKNAVDLNGRYFDALTTFGKSLFYLKHFGEAQKYLEKAKDINPREPENLFFLAQVLEYLGDYNRAITLLDIAEKSENWKGKALFLKGKILLSADSPSQAIVELEKSLNYTKSTDQILLTKYLIANCYEKMKNLSKAIEYWEYIHNLQPDYKDVKAKLKQYQELRHSDEVKDLVIANKIQFETIFRKILDNMDLKPLMINFDNDVTITAICTNKNQGSIYKTHNILVRLFREFTPINEHQVRDFHEKMKSENAIKGYFISVSEFSSSAIDYCNNRPIELYNASMITQLLKK